jgi:hypothetical protein
MAEAEEPGVRVAIIALFGRLTIEVAKAATIVGEIITETLQNARDMKLLELEAERKRQATTLTVVNPIFEGGEIE